jgi:predicted nuclease of predicted toxin-antitoxin system
VFQVRARTVSPEYLAPLVFRSLRQFSAELESDALVTVDEASQRVRLLLTFWR